MKALKSLSALCIAVLLLLSTGTALGLKAEYEGVKVTPIKKSTTASNGQKLEYPKTDSPEVTALIVEIPPGAETGWHYHPIPVYAYMLSGSITVEMENGEKYDFNEGDVIFEVVNISHNGRNSGNIAAKLVVFYLGEEGKPLTIKGRPGSK